MPEFQVPVTELRAYPIQRDWTGAVIGVLVCVMFFAGFALGGLSAMLLRKTENDSTDCNCRVQPFAPTPSVPQPSFPRPLQPGNSNGNTGNTGNTTGNKIGDK